MVSLRQTSRHLVTDVPIQMLRLFSKFMFVAYCLTDDNRSNGAKVQMERYTAGGAGVKYVENRVTTQ